MIYTYFPPFRLTLLHPSHSFLTELRTFMPRVWTVHNDDVRRAVVAVVVVVVLDNDGEEEIMGRESVVNVFPVVCWSAALLHVREVEAQKRDRGVPRRVDGRRSEVIAFRRAIVMVGVRLVVVVRIPGFQSFGVRSLCRKVSVAPQSLSIGNGIN